MDKTIIFQQFKKPWVIILLALMVAGGVGLLSINSIMISILHSRPEVAVPDLEGKSLMESLRIVSQAGLSLKEDGTEYDEGLPAGTILRQHPPAGMKVREGRPVQVVISKGGQGAYVPVVVGKPLPEAQSILGNDRLQMGAVISIYSSAVGEGLVISQDPSSGTVVTRGALVDVQVSKGPPPSGAPIIPDFFGQTIEAVQKWAEGVNVKVKISEDEKAVGIAGTVIRQSPLVGQPVLEDDMIRVTVVPLAAQKGERFSYQVPADRTETVVKIMARDNKGESQIYKRNHKGGDTIEFPIAVSATTRVRIYLDEILQEERVIEP
jgi:eukaryotic-like serine/threonine-protein kinase